MVVEQVMSAQMAGKLKSPLMKELTRLYLHVYIIVYFFEIMLVIADRQ
jgi:hypothetical protein